MGIGLVAAVAFVVYDGGYRDSMMGGMSMPSMGQLDDTVIMNKYPDAESLRIAVDKGEVDYDKLSSVAQAIVDEHREENPVIIMPSAEPPVIEEPEVPVQPEEVVESEEVVGAEPPTLSMSKLDALSSILIDAVAR